MKKCNKCNKFFGDKDFNSKNVCIFCYAEYKKEYYIKNKEKIKQKKQEYYLNNKDKVLNKVKNYLNNNRDKILKTKKEYRDKNRKILNDKQKKYNINNKKKRQEYSKNYYQKNKDKITNKTKKYYNENLLKIKEQNKIYRKNNKHKMSKYRQDNNESIRRQSNNNYHNNLKKNPLFKLRANISGQINKYLTRKNINKNNKSILNHLGYTINDLKNHIEFLFESWMNWNNQGSYVLKDWNDNDKTTWKWSLDHIIPHSHFNYTSMEDEEFKKCWALSNLRPYSAKQNNLDGNRR